MGGGVYYDLREYRKQIECDEEIAKKLQDRNKSNVWAETSN